MNAIEPAGAMNAAQQETMLNTAVAKCWKRLMPFMFIFYFVAFIDRVNVGFAKDAMSIDLKMPTAAYALGAGIFFAGYAIAGVPANILLNRIGAKVWLSAMAIIWGLLSASTGFVTSPTQFVVLRFVLGVAEAGFYPGILLLASIFFPDETRASVIAIFVLGVPLSLTLGSPISGALLQLHGFMGQPGWFWMFLLEGVPAVILGLFGLYYLDDNPSLARFLTAEEKAALVKQLASEAQKTQARDIGAALVSLRVWHLAAIYGTIQIAVYGLIFFLPSQVAKLMGATLGFKVSLVAAIPWAVSAVGVYLIPRLADRYPTMRVQISVICMILSAIGIFISAFASPVLAIAALSVSAVGFLAVQPVFWTFPTRFLSGSALAAGIGFCTTIGAVCSFLAPIIRVQADQAFHSPHAGLMVMSLFSILSAVLIFLLRARVSEA
ncbi:MFS transporter [Acidisoma cellulosilytica]|uniref:MFS transporter n=1 Tax=Acidisoma cellulosilyticum TaxID=2802395 RepID=A0A963Z374_9PROT|nr:MFS transporter [Acidisoma cellulosilyticum]MCB8881142.1 MFS transporter [Acidisoma cellulosilyticum]